MPGCVPASPHGLVPTTERKAKHTQTSCPPPTEAAGRCWIWPWALPQLGLGSAGVRAGLAVATPAPKGRTKPQELPLAPCKELSEPHSIPGGLCQAPQSLQEAQVNSCIWDDLPPFFLIFLFFFLFQKAHMRLLPPPIPSWETSCI